MLNKIVIVNKEQNLTSRDVVNKLNKIFNTKKIGHTGTLDPMATGVLVCLVGKYTKLINLITSYDKEYIAIVKLGIKTDTLDITGNVLLNEEIPKLDKEEIENVLNTFLGVYTQTVPLYSAVHVNGKRLYEYARNNEEVVLPKRDVTIKEMELLEYNYDLIKFRVVVSHGTYIRSLIDDICIKLNTIGVMSSLVRTRVGNFKLSDAYTLEDIKNNNYKTKKLEDVIPLQVVDIKENMYKKIINGNILNLEYKGYILFKYNNKNIALYEFINNIGYLKILF